MLESKTWPHNLTITVPLGQHQRVTSTIWVTPSWDIPPQHCNLALIPCFVLNWLCPLCLTPNMQRSKQNNTETDLLKSSDRGRDGDRDSTARELLQLIKDRTPAVPYVTLCPCFCCAVYVYILFGRVKHLVPKEQKNNSESPSQLSLLFFPKCFIYSTFFSYQHACIFYLHPLKLDWKENKKSALKVAHCRDCTSQKVAYNQCNLVISQTKKLGRTKGFHSLSETIWSHTASHSFLLW